jgi:hypothetical protein
MVIKDDATLDCEEVVMDETVLDDIVGEVGRDLVSQMAPEELILYRAKSDAFFKDLRTGRKKARQTDEMLGLGAAEIVPFVTPVILYALEIAVKPLVVAAAKRLGADAGDSLSNAIRRLFKRPTRAGANSAEVSGLTPAEVAQAHFAAVEAVLSCRRSPEQARQIADAIVAHLTIASETKPLGQRSSS